jgi:DNA-binding MarR family transcriptional regulator
MTKQSMAQLVEHLEAHGYVERVPDPGDRRARLVRTTPLGRAVFAVVRELLEEIDAELAGRLGPERVAALRTLLTELRTAL